MKSGSCLCGNISFDVEGPIRPVICCHCQQCRKTSGHHVAATSAPRDAITITGDVTWFQSSANVRRGFCNTCGSNLFFDGPGKNLSIFAGTMDTSLDVGIAGHIFCADKADYYEISDDVPCSAGYDPDLTTMVPETSGC